MTAHPPLRPFGGVDVPAPTGAEAADFDAWAVRTAGVPEPVLMENAGRAAAAVLDRFWPAGPVVGLVGAGNNGGDALVLLRTLAAWGRPVTAVVVGDREPSALLHGWTLPTVTDADLDRDGWEPLLSAAAVVVDGILGTGIRGAPRERQAAAIARVNGSGRPVLAMDVPSGVNAATGAVAGQAIRADVTVAFGAPKLGGLLHPGRARTGRTVALEIGFPPMGDDRAGARVVTPAWAQARLPVFAADTHKNAVGRLTLVAGSAGMAGAAILSARAAFRAGVGLVRVCSDAGNAAAIHAAVPEALFVDVADASALDDALARADAVALGPGLGTTAAAAAATTRVLEGRGAPLVVDADGLNLVAAGRAPDLASVARHRGLLVTPHPGEMRRLRPEADSDDPVGTARQAAKAWGCAVLLKGATSVVASPDAPVLVDVGGSSDLAVAGMGDVLTGVAAALMARGLAPADAGSVALYLTGRAAKRSGRGRGTMPSDVVRWLPDALAERGAGVTDLDLPFVTFDLDAAH